MSQRVRLELGGRSVPRGNDFLEVAKTLNRTGTARVACVIPPRARWAEVVSVRAIRCLPRDFEIVARNVRMLMLTAKLFKLTEESLGGLPADVVGTVLT